MEKDAKIYVAGHRGLVGSAIMRCLAAGGYDNVVTRTHAELDLTSQAAVRDFFEQERPEYVFLAAAKVGGILANNTYPAEFIHQNLAIQTNVIHESWRAGVKRLLFLGSSCIYPRDCPQPIKEEYLLTGPLEATNRPYAVAKIAGIEMCWAYNRQYGTQYLAVMPTNLYGPGDNYDLEKSHVIPALIRKFHEAKTRTEPKVVVWGTGTPRREFLYSDDMADGCVFLMKLPDDAFAGFLSGGSQQIGAESPPLPPLVNVGLGQDLTIRELAEAVKGVVGYDGEITFDTSKPDGTPRKVLDTSRLRRLGWQASTPLELGLARAYGDFCKLEHARRGEMPMTEALK
jgi:GDP-L-fucose synthase